jgi:serine phosphatase RsbU (regulator of sigma subunit)
LLSDGVTEATDHIGQQGMFGVERLKNLLQTNLQQNQNSEDGNELNLVLEQILAYANHPKDFDDMTLLDLSI